MKSYKTDNNTFMIYKDWQEMFAALSDKQAGILIKALFSFAKGEDVPQLTGMTQMAFIMMSQQIDRDGVKWEKTCQKRAEAGKKGGKQKQANLANATNANQIIANLADKDTDTDTEKDTDTEREKEREHTPAFTPPTVEEVQAYCAERKNKIDPDRFVNYHAAVGWLRNGQQITDWKAVVNIWESKEPNTCNKFDDSSIDMDDVEKLVNRF